MENESTTTSNQTLSNNNVQFYI